MKKKKALICGVSGQDGAYLARFLLERGYDVFGTSRDAQISSFERLQILGIRDQVSVESVAINDFRSVLQALDKIEPDEIFNLAGQSSVGLSFQQPIETFESINVGVLNLLESIRFISKPIKLYNACSGECFGDTNGALADEETAFKPRSPYAVAKAASFWATTNYRDAYGLFACSGVLFNHESPLRPERFVTKKIIAAAYRIKNGSDEKLHLGNLSISRDWGWAPEYVEAMWLMLQQDEPEDFVIATGEAHSLKVFTSHAFATLDLDWEKHVVTDEDLFRPADISFNCGNPSRAAKKLGWKAKTKMPEVITKMIEAEKNNSLTTRS